MIRTLILILAALLPWSAPAAEPLTFTGGTAHFGATHATPGQRTLDEWTFDLPVLSFASASLVSISLLPTSDWQFRDAAIDGDGISVSFLPAAVGVPGLAVWAITDAVLPPASYTLRVEGWVPANRWAGSYAGTINVSPVPEPSALAMSAAGLLAVGWVAYRRRQNITTAR
jgi:hypothetical protein